MKRWPILLFILPVTIFANEDLTLLTSLAEDVRDVVIETETDAKGKVPGQEFILDEETTEFLDSLQELDKEIATIVPESLNGGDSEVAPQSEDPCKDNYSVDQAVAERIKGRKFQIYFTATFSKQAEIGLNPGFAGRNNYRNFMTASSTEHPDAYNIRSIQSLESRYKNQKNPSDWDSLSTLERAQRLQEFAVEYSGANPSLGLILSEYAIQGMTSNPSNWKQELNAIKDHLTFDEKLKVASHFGGRFSDNYNYNRADGTGPRAEGIVTIEEMLESVRDGVPGGVCRDVSQAQSLMLQELGVNSSDIYQAAYSTATAAHVVLAVRDPENPDRIVKINYDYTDETSDRSGGAVLTQSSSLPDFGSNFRIYDSAGKPVGKVPTEFGDVLRDVTNQRELSDGITKNHNLQRVFVDTPYGVGSVFTGTTSSGDNIVGVAITNKASEEETNSRFEYGIAAVQREGERATVKIRQDALYGFMKYTYNTPRIERGNFSIGASGGSEADVLLMDNTAAYNNGIEKSGTNIEATSGIHLGADLRYASDDNRTRIRTGLTYSGYIDVQNEQEGPSGGLMLATDKIVWDSAIERDISENMTFIGESAIVFRDIGNSAAFKGTLVDTRRDIAGSLVYQTPLDGDMPAFNPMYEETVGLGVTKYVGDKNNNVRGSFYLEYNKSLTFENSESVGAGFGIHF